MNQLKKNVGAIQEIESRTGTSYVLVNHQNILIRESSAHKIVMHKQEAAQTPKSGSI